MEKPPINGPSDAEGAGGRSWRQKRRDVYFKAGQMYVLLAAVVIGGLVVSNLNRSPSRTVHLPTVSGTPDWVSTLPFNCLGSAGLAVGPTSPLARIDAVRTDTNARFDRVTIQFTDGAPHDVHLSTQQGAKFAEGASGQTVTLMGQNGALVTLHNADGHTDYSGLTDIKTGYRVVLELRRVQDFEGTVQWAIGLSQVPCYRMALMDNPARLVVDFRAGSATT